tara:strand:+ start:9090 stop:9677 length:588 start_codon:yes stop_codon:yes gene_type:complete
MIMEKLQPKGHLEIIKIYDDGTEEVHFKEDNMIVSGMGVGLSHLYSGSGGGTISDFQIVNFQVGTGGDLTSYGTSSFKLVTPCTSGEYLSTGSEANIENFEPIQNSVLAAATESFIRFPFNNIQKIDKNTVRYNLIIDKFTLNGLSTNIDEVGLFMRNPRGVATNAKPILVAYRPFNGLKKTSTFSLLLKWTLNF